MKANELNKNLLQKSNNELRKLKHTLIWMTTAAVIYTFFIIYTFVG